MCIMALKSYILIKSFTLKPVSAVNNDLYYMLSLKQFSFSFHRSFDLENENENHNRNQHSKNKA